MTTAILTRPVSSSAALADELEREDDFLDPKPGVGVPADFASLVPILSPQPQRAQRKPTLPIRQKGVHRQTSADALLGFVYNHLDASDYPLATSIVTQVRQYMPECLDVVLGSDVLFRLTRSIIRDRISPTRYRQYVDDVPETSLDLAHFVWPNAMAITEQCGESMQGTAQGGKR